MPPRIRLESKSEAQLQPISMCSDKAIDRFYSPDMHKTEMHEYIFGASEYIGQLNFWKRSEIKEFGEILELDSEAHLLDIGSGYGGPACYLSTVFGCQVTGVEVTPSNYRVACQNVEQKGLEGKVRFLHENILESKFPDETFNAGMALDSVVHIENKGKLFEHCYRWLKPNGKLLIAVECVKDGIPARLKSIRESKGVVFCDTAQGYRDAMRQGGFQLLVEKKYPTKRMNFSTKALRWMDSKGQSDARESMEIINRLCKLGYAEEVVFILKKVV